MVPPEVAGAHCPPTSRSKLPSNQPIRLILPREALLQTSPLWSACYNQMGNQRVLLWNLVWYLIWVKWFFCKISKRLIDTSNKNLNKLYYPIANPHLTAVGETLKKLRQKGMSILLDTMPRTDHQTKSLNSYFSMLCPQQGLNTWQHKEIFVERQLSNHKKQ